jgi:hypothetical protein
MNAIGNNNFCDNKQCELRKDLCEELNKSEKSIFDSKT